MMMRMMRYSNTFPSFPSYYCFQLAASSLSSTQQKLLICRSIDNQNEANPRTWRKSFSIFFCELWERERENDLWFPKISIVPVSYNSFNILIVSTKFESESSTGTFQNFSLSKTKNDDNDANDFFVFEAFTLTSLQ